MTSNDHGGEAEEEAGSGEDYSPVHIHAFLIADIRGYTRYTAQHGDEGAARLAKQFAALCREAVTAHHGSVIELRGDEALAAFTSSRNALWSAIDLQNRIARTDELGTLGVGIGLDAGEAIRVESGFRGAALNRAARLCSIAKSAEILATDGIVHLAGRLDGVAFEERGYVPLKGFDEPVRTLSVNAIQNDSEAPEADVRLPEGAAHPGTPILPIGGYLGSRPSTVLVGREAEVVRAHAHVDAVRNGRGQVVTLVGEPGIGKTRLAQELSQYLGDQNFLLASGTCYETRQSSPFYPFLDVIEGLYAATSKELRQQVPARFPYLRKLLPAESIPSMPEHPVDKEEHDWLFWSVTNFVQALSNDSPLAILLDDLHWSDSSTLELLQHLARHTRGKRILILGTYRDVEVNRLHPLGSCLRGLHREGLLDEIPLRRLTGEGTAALAAAAFGEQEVSAEFAGLLYRHTEGNPFFTQEVLRTLVERGDLFSRDGRWDRKVLEEIEVPKSVREAIGERLSHLQVPVQEILRIASVLGQRFRVDDLIATSALDEDEIEKALEEAARSQLVQPTDPDTNVFTHALIRQTLYGELSPRRQRKLHLAAGQTIESVPEKERMARATELAWHFFRADEPDRAMRWALISGDQAEAVFAHQDAEAQYRMALDLAGELESQKEAAEASEKLGAVLNSLGRHEEALDTLKIAERAYGAQQDTDGMLRVAAHVGRAYANTERNSQGIAHVEGLLKALGDVSPSRALGLAYTALAGMYFGNGKYHDQMVAGERAAGLARQLGDDALLVDAESQRAQALGHSMGMEAARSVYESILPLAERVASISTLHRIVNNLAFSYFFAGDFGRNVTYRLRALQLAEHQGEVGRIAFALAMAAQGLHFVGRWGEARDYAKRAVDLSKSLGNAWNVTYVHAQFGYILLGLGEFHEAGRHLDRARENAERYNDLQGLGFATEADALLLLWQGDPDAALKCVERQLERLDPDDSSRAWVTWILASIELERGNVGRAHEVIEAHIERGRTAGDNWAVMEGLRVQGQILAAQDHWDGAEDSFAEAELLATAAPYPFALAQTLHERGRMRMHRGMPNEGREDIRKALSMAQELGAKYHARLFEETLVKSGKDRNRR